MQPALTLQFPGINLLRRFTAAPMAIDFERQKFFWSRVEKEGDHLIWTGTKTPRDYGIITINGREEYAHRASWCIAQGIDLSDISQFHLVRVNCNRNDCVEPSHFATKPKTSRQMDLERKNKAKR